MYLINHKLRYVIIFHFNKSEHKQQAHKHIFLYIIEYLYNAEKVFKHIKMKISNVLLLFMEEKKRENKQIYRLIKSSR